MQRILSLLVLVGSLTAAHVAAAQPAELTVFTGTVTDAETGRPLEGAHVFIAGSMTGTVTDAQGRYRIQGVPPGAHRLYVSMIGFEPVPRDVLLREGGVRIEDFALAPAVAELGEVIVEAEGDPRWQERLERFVRLFIGETPNAAEVEILNPEVLDFSARGEFRAFADEPLVIENRALGYRITYFLEEFGATPTRTRYDGEPLFEPMAPTSPEQAEAWRERRSEAFYGSLRHFMLALFQDRVEEQGFRMYHRPSSGNVPGADAGFGRNALSGRQRFPVEPEELLKEGETPNERVLAWPGTIEIVFMGEEETPAYLKWRGEGGRPGFQTSQLWQENGPTVLDYKGDILDPYGVTVSGFLAFERVADELPREYRPWNER